MKIYLVLFVLLCVNGCAAFKEAGAVYQTSFDFSKVESYSLYERNSEVIEFQKIDDITRNGIEIAIEKSMDAQGFFYSEMDVADVVVTYHLVGRRGRDISTYNESVRYCSYCLRANTWQSENKNWELSPGQLIIDLVDPKSKRSVWRSVYPLDIDVEDNSQEVNRKIQSNVASMLALYPSQPIQ